MLLIYSKEGIYLHILLSEVLSVIYYFQHNFLNLAKYFNTESTSGRNGINAEEEAQKVNFLH